MSLINNISNWYHLFHYFNKAIWHQLFWNVEDEIRSSGDINDFDVDDCRFTCPGYRLCILLICRNGSKVDKYIPSEVLVIIKILEQKWQYGKPKPISGSEPKSLISSNIFQKSTGIDKIRASICYVYVHFQCPCMYISRPRPQLHLEFFLLPSEI